MIHKYHVEPGDTVSKVVEKFEIHLNGIENDFDSLLLLENQLILVPVANLNSIMLHEYKTSQNDTLKGIADSFSVTTKALKYFNDIDHLILIENQELSINDENVSQVFVIDYDNI